MLNFFKRKKVNSLYAPVTREVIAIEDVPDKIFVEKLMGIVLNLNKKIKIIIVKKKRIII